MKNKQKAELSSLALRIDLALASTDCVAHVVAYNVLLDGRDCLLAMIARGEYGKAGVRYVRYCIGEHAALMSN